MSSRAFLSQRPLAGCACAFGCGLYLGLKGAFFAWPFALAGPVLCLMLLKAKGGRMVSLCALLFFLGVVHGGLAVREESLPLGKTAVEGRVEGIASVRESDGRVQAVLADVRVQRGDGTAQHIGKAYWTFYPAEGASPLYDGQAVRFTGTVYRPKGQVNPYGFDFRLYLGQRGIRAGISGARDLSVTGLARHRDFWLRARLHLAGRLDGLFGPHSALPKALLIGERGDMEEDAGRLFRLAGVAHVLAISGLHVSLLAGMLLAALKRCRVAPAWRLAAAALFLLAYCRFLSFQDSVVRASLMTVIVLAGYTVRKRRDVLTALAAAFFCILVFRPLDLMNVGFQLSFLAVTGLAVTGDALAWAVKKRWDSLSPAAVRVLSACFAAVAAGLWTLPIIANAFHTVSLAGIAYSPLAILWVMALMVGYIALLGLSFVSMPLAQAAVGAVGLAGQWFTEATARIGSLPGASVRVPALPFWWAAFIFLALWLCSRYTRLAVRGRAAILAGALLVCGGLSLAARDGAVRYTQFSLGNADAAVIEDGKATYVVDAGEYGGDLASYLLSRRRGVDTLFVTHLHTDHVGGLAQLMQQEVPIAEIVLADGAEKAGDIGAGLALLREAESRGIPVRYVGAGDAGGSARARYAVRWPYAGKTYPGMPANHHSMALLWELDGLRLLHMGDVSGLYERYAASPAQVLKAAHHGDKKASGEEFLRIVSPQVVLVSDDGSQRARAMDGRAPEADVYHTGDTGALTLRVENGMVKVQPFLGGKGSRDEGQ